MTGPPLRSSPVAADLGRDDAVARVLAEIEREIVAVFGGGLDPVAIRADVDVFGTEQVIEGRWLDSMGLVQLIAAVEDHFGVRLAALITGDEPVTLTTVARHIARSRP